MPDELPYAVFLSPSAKDKAVVRPLAERLAGGRAAQELSTSPRLGRGAVGVRHVPVSRPAEQGTAFHALSL